MSANIPIICPKCSQSFNLRYDPGVEDAAPAAAVSQLETECPNHSGGWRFWGTLPDSVPSDPFNADVWAEETDPDSPDYLYGTAMGRD